MLGRAASLVTAMEPFSMDAAGNWSSKLEPRVALDTPEVLSIQTSLPDVEHQAAALMCCMTQRSILDVIFTA